MAQQQIVTKRLSAKQNLKIRVTQAELYVTELQEKLEKEFEVRSGLEKHIVELENDLVRERKIRKRYESYRSPDMLCVSCGFSTKP